METDDEIIILNENRNIPKSGKIKNKTVKRSRKPCSPMKKMRDDTITNYFKKRKIE